MKIGIGIDTGGTYTDAVVYDFDSSAILAGAKALTTKQNLTIGILEAIDRLPDDLTRQAEVISLSTTLATNACVEDRGGQAKLIFFGGNPAVIDRNGAQYGLPSSSDILLFDSAATFSGDSVREPDWDNFRQRIAGELDPASLDGVGILEMNSMKTGAVTEKKAKTIVQETLNLPVVCGHELFSELNSLRRGASTLLNAGLFPVIREFLDAVKQALDLRGIHPASLAIVRSDGTLMSEEFAALRPVETLLCGPAASAIGCSHLSDCPNAIVVDMGGTTTDLAFIQNGLPLKVTGGVSIGRWKTFVGGLYVKTFGLGGDSAVHYEGKKLILEEFRVTPLCVAAAKYPSVLNSLRRIDIRKHTRFLYEHYMLIRDIDGNQRYTNEEQSFCRALKDAPLPLTQAAAAFGTDIYTLPKRAERLIHDGIVQICGFTPTDAMHIKGDFSEYSAEASRLGAEFAAYNLDCTVDDLCDRVYDEVKKKMYVNIVKAMLENKFPDYRKNGVSPDAERFILETFCGAKNDDLIAAQFRTDYVLVGVGAPIGVFLEDVAKKLGTRAVIPEHHEVANALGAIVGSIRVVHSIEILPDNGAEGTFGHLVFGSEGRKRFKELADAIDYAREQAEAEAKAEAVRRGAHGEITVTSEVRTNDAEMRDGAVYLGTVVTAYATDTMGFLPSAVD